MIRKTSNYRYSYRDTDKKSLRKSWEINNRYRDMRRQNEHCHTPIWWADEDEWLSLEGDDSNSNSDWRPASVPIHKYKHEKHNKDYQDKLRRSADAKLARYMRDKYKNISPDSGIALAGSPDTSPTTSSPKPKQSLNMSQGSGELKQKLDQKKSEKNKEERKHKKEEVVKEREPSDKEKKSHKTKEGHHGKKHQEKTSQRHARPKSAPEGRDSMNVNHYEKYNHMSGITGMVSPFITYGAKDKERAVGRKKTFNIRAAAEIYPSALKALHNRELMLQEYNEKTRGELYREHLSRILQKSKDKRDNEKWMSEYGRNYVNYDKDLYKHNFDKRFNPKMMYQEYGNQYTF